MSDLWDSFLALMRQPTPFGTVLFLFVVSIWAAATFNNKERP